MKKFFFKELSEKLWQEKKKRRVIDTSKEIYKSNAEEKWMKKNKKVEKKNNPKRIDIPKN